MTDGDDDHLDAYLDAVLVGGREERTVEIVDYRHDWPVRFESERRRLTDALGTTAVRIEHVGSTAVPGLAAKPILDILVSVEDPEDESAYSTALQEAGYELRVREPGHRMFRTPERDVHVHVWRSGGVEEQRQLAFRDRLRASAGARARYEDTKRSLAGRYRDVNYYAEAKSAVIEDILRERDENAPGDA